jgi:hypothetical protein
MDVGLGRFVADFPSMNNRCIDEGEIKNPARLRRVLADARAFFSLSASLEDSVASKGASSFNARYQT